MYCCTSLVCMVDLSESDGPALNGHCRLGAFMFEPTANQIHTFSTQANEPPNTDLFVNGEVFINFSSVNYMKTFVVFYQVLCYTCYIVLMRGFGKKPFKEIINNYNLN